MSKGKATGLVLLALVLGIPSAFAGGSNIGGTDGGSAFLVDWCRANLGVLEDARARAAVSISMNELGDAKHILQEGLASAIAQTAERIPLSLTHRAIERGLELSTAIDDTLGFDSRAVEASVAFLSNYYTFILDTAAPLDTSYYIPYRYGHGFPEEGGEAEFERRFEDYAREQIRWFVTEFSSRGLDGSYIPRYSAKIYLKALEFLARYTAEDLGESLWKARYFCVIDQLMRLNTRLASFNGGNLAAYRNERWAVNAGTSEILLARGKIAKAGCGY